MRGACQSKKGCHFNSPISLLQYFKVMCFSIINKLYFLIYGLLYLYSFGKIFFMHISQNKLFFPLIDVFFDADSKSETRIFRTALVF